MKYVACYFPEFLKIIPFYFLCKSACFSVRNGGFPGGASGKDPCLPMQRLRCVGSVPERPLRVGMAIHSCSGLGESLRTEDLVGYSP